MPKHRRQKRGRKLKPWVSKARKKQKGGFFFLPFLIAAGSAIASAVSAAAPVIATGALSAAAGYGATKLIDKISSSSSSTPATTLAPTTQANTTPATTIPATKPTARLSRWRKGIIRPQTGAGKKKNQNGGGRMLVPRLPTFKRLSGAGKKRVYRRCH